jgi:outer membrane protein assembly factor BamB
MCAVASAVSVSACSALSAVPFTLWAAAEPLAAPLPPSPAASAGAVDWNQWRGPDRSGITPETGWTFAWPPAGPPVAWKVKLRPGYSSVAVSRGRVYTMGWNRGRDTVYCLDAATGNTLWEHTYACGGSPYPEARTTPSVDGNAVYTVGKLGVVCCLDAATGKVNWSKNVQEELQAPFGRWRLTASPLVEGDLLLVAAGKGLVAMEKSSGAVRWHIESEQHSFSPALAFTTARGERRVAVVAGTEVILARLPGGAVLWRHPWRPEYPTTIADPVVSGDRMFISTNYLKGALLDVGGQAPRVLWQNKDLLSHVATAILWKGCLWGFHGDVRTSATCMVCMDFDTGAVRWKQPMKGSGIMAGGKLLLTTFDGDLVVAEADPGGYKELARAKVLEEPCWTVPVLSGGRIYCRGKGGTLVCLDVRPSASPRPAAEGSPRGR